MKKLFFTTLAFLIFLIITGFQEKNKQADLTGAWQSKKGTIEQVAIFQDGYFSITLFDIANKKFIRTFGGSFSHSNEQLHAAIEFDTELTSEIGKLTHYTVKTDGNKLSMDAGTGISEWTRTDNGTGELAGNWRITGRMSNGSMQQIQKGARKTLKLLSGTRFQWIAINPETKDFFGTGGGTYTFKDGKYTEHIEFFSRDNSRVGASLSFEGSVSGNVWTHKGLSSKGDPIHEEWTLEL